MATLLRRSNDRTDAAAARPQDAEVRPLVLVAEDHEDTRFMLTFLLEMWGCHVAAAKDGEEAVRLAEVMRPDLILMDAGLPGLDGLSATRRIRDTPELRRVPVVFLSGHAEAHLRAAALATGGDEYLTKPFEVGQLEKVLDRHLERRRAAAAE